MSTLVRYSGASLRGFESQCLICKNARPDRTAGEIDVPLGDHLSAVHRTKPVRARQVVAWSWSAETLAPRKKFFFALTDPNHPDLYLGALTGDFTPRLTVDENPEGSGRVVLDLPLSLRWVPMNQACQQYVPLVVTYRLDRDDPNVALVRSRMVVRASAPVVIPVGRVPVDQRGYFQCAFKYDASRELEPFFPNVLIPSLPPMIHVPVPRAAPFAPEVIRAATLPPYSTEAPPDPPPPYEFALN